VGAARLVSLSRLCGNVRNVPTEIERLYREQRAGLVRLVERELHDHHDAEDVVQTAFLDAQRALERGTIPRQPHAWLAAIALNAARRLRRRRVNADPLEEYAVQEALGVSEIRAALANLPSEQRAAVLYRDLLGLSYGETAEQMGTSVNAVTMLLHRGRQRLRQTLGMTVAGVGLGRWLRRAGVSQAAVAKGTVAVIVAGGLATTGVVAARVAAPIGGDAAASPPRSGSPTKGAHRRTSAGAPEPDVARRDAATADRARTSTAPGPTQSSSEVATTTEPSRSSPLVSVPTVSVPAVQVPTVPATVTAVTPVTTVTATLPVSTTVTATTPITTVTVPIP
jgi:RNA polymerase sigma-70 factor, ECF subfamily